MSKFSALKDLRNSTTEETDAPQRSAVEQEGTLPHVQQQHAVQQAQAAKIGKRNNPDYVQRTAYIRKQTDLAVKMKLLQQGGKQEFSELVDALLSKWLQDE